MCCGAPVANRRCQASAGPRRSHDVRHFYTCYQRRTAKACDQPYLSQEKLETDLFRTLEAIALPEGVAEAVDAAVAAMRAGNGRETRQVSLKTIDARLERQRDLCDLGDITREEYLRRRDDLGRQRLELTATTPEPLFVRQRTLLRSIVEDCDHVTVAERKTVVASIFETITAGEDELECTPRESWKDFVRAVVPSIANKSAPYEGGHERKTGVKRTEVITARVVRDDRGWLRLTA